MNRQRSIAFIRRMGSVPVSQCMDDTPGTTGDPYLNIYLSLKMMKIFTCILVCDDGGRKRRLRNMPFPPQEKDICVYYRIFMSPEPEIDSGEELKLDSLMEEACQGADMLEELAALAVRPGHLF